MSGRELLSSLETAANAATPAPLDLAPLPSEVTYLLVALAAPPRLAAHLRAVHDVALRLLVALPLAWPSLVIDAGAVAFGAATHDIGKSLHTNELGSPGSQHEESGYQLLVTRGVSADRARFARTHSRWSADDATFEDQLVALADKIWKGQREEELERVIVARLASMAGSAQWKVFSRLDEILEDLAIHADARLAFQGSFATDAA